MAIKLNYTNLFDYLIDGAICQEDDLPYLNVDVNSGLAEHPASELKFELQQQFGENRCEIVANALLEAHQNSDESQQARMQYITGLKSRFYQGLVLLRNKSPNPYKSEVLGILFLSLHNGCASAGRQKFVTTS